MQKKFFFFSIWHILVFLPVAIFSLEDEEIPSITVYGSYQKNSNALVNSTTIIKGEELSRGGATVASDAVRKITGTFFNTNGNVTSINSIAMRGGASTQVAILINGNKINSPTGAGGSDLSKIPISAIEQIEVIKGASSSISGDSSNLGLINIVTKVPLEATYEAGYSYSLNNGHNLNFFTTQSFEKINSGLLTGFNFIYNPTDIKIVGGDKIIDAFLFNLIFDWQWEKDNNKVFFSNYFEEQYNIEEIGNRLQLFSSLHIISWKLINFLPEFASSSNLLSFSFRPIDSKYGNEILSSTSTFSFSLKDNFRFSHDFQNNSLEFSLSGEYEPQLFTSKAIDFLHRHNLSAQSYLQVAFNTESREVGFFEVTARLDGVLGDKNYFFPSLNGGFLFNFDKNKISKIRLSAGNGFKAPTFNELYYNDSHFAPNPHLTAQKSVTFDTSIIVNPIEEIEIGATYFFRKEYAPIIWGENSAYQGNESNFNGVEIWFNFDFNLENGFNTFLISNYNFTHGIDLNKKIIPSYHPHIFKSTLGFGYKKYFSIAFETNYFSGYKYETGEIDPFWEFNIKSQIGIKDFYLTLGGENLANQNLRFHPYTTSLGPGFSIGLKYKS